MRIVLGSFLLAACGAVPALAPEDRLVAAGGPDHVLVRMAPGPGVAGGFWIGRFEVTQAQYAAFVQATGYDGREAPSSKPSEPFLGDWQDGAPPAGQGQHPVAQVNWHHAQAFCRWLSERTGRSVRLPTDAEWAWAARGRHGRVYPWGDEWSATRCNWGDGGASDGFPKAAPVGSFPSGATPEGVHDLAGNIWEWVAEGHLRGGPRCMGPETVRADAIAREDRERADDKFGFRIVVEVP